MENKVNKMIKRINEEIKQAKSYYDRTNDNDYTTLNKIYGMIEMLEILTDKKYILDENGIKEL